MSHTGGNSSFNMVSVYIFDTIALAISEFPSASVGEVANICFNVKNAERLPLSALVTSKVNSVAASNFFNESFAF